MNLESALQARRDGKYKRAVELYDRAVSEDPHNAAAHAGLALTHIYLEQNEAALAEANKALELDQNQHYAHVALAAIHHKDGELEQFRAEIEKAFALQPFVYEVGCMYARMLFDEKKIDEALPLFERIIESNPKKVCPHYLLGLGYAYKKRYRESLREYAVAFRVQPSFDLALAVLTATTNLYRPWSNILAAGLLLIWFLASFISIPFLIGWAAFLDALLIVRGVQWIRAGHKMTGVLCFVSAVGSTLIYLLVFLWLR